MQEPRNLAVAKLGVWPLQIMKLYPEFFFMFKVFGYSSFADGVDADTLRSRACVAGQVPAFTSGAWSCNTPVSDEGSPTDTEWAARVWNVTCSSSGCMCLKMRCPDARVACPHRSTSSSGVNHLRSYSLRLAVPGLGAKKSVSERFISDAIACIALSGIHSASGQTAAGFPENGLSVKASIW